MLPCAIARTGSSPATLFDSFKTGNGIMTCRQYKSSKGPGSVPLYSFSLPLSICFTIHLISTSNSIYLCVCVSVCLSVCLSMAHLSVYLSIYLPFHLFVHLCLSPPLPRHVYTPAHMHLCMYVRQDRMDIWIHVCMRL